MRKIKKAQKHFAEDPLFIEVMEEALKIQDRFAAEPIYAKTGKGFLRSGGVGELVELKRSQEREPKQCK